MRYRYKVIVEKGKLKSYSGMFKNKTVALRWYFRYGKWLEDQFDRKLVLTEFNPDLLLKP